jgi:predicted TIM-barrel fold metal-dependent hydrolase
MKVNSAEKLFNLNIIKIKKMKNRIHSWFSEKSSPMFVFTLLMVAGACNSQKQAKEEFLTEADFAKMKKIDIHCHVNVERPAFMEQAVADNFLILTINTDAFERPTIEEQQEFALTQMKAFPGRLAYLTTFSLKGWDDEGWQEKTLAYLDESFKKGAIGVKVWKNIGMVEKDQDGNFIMIDDPKFDPIFNYLEENNIPVCGHLGEPKNCWLPLEEMTVNNDRIYFEEHPQYHMYLHPEFPSYEEQIAARDRMLEKHPNLKFMGAHLSSLEWSVDELAAHFDRFPNATADLAERICHIEVQAQADWQKVRDFFVKYQDHIIYGTDRGDYEGAEQDPEKLKDLVREEWRSDWKFLTTDETISSWKVNGDFKGLKLPREVVEKVYYKNAEKVFPEFKRIKKE